MKTTLEPQPVHPTIETVVFTPTPLLTPSSVLAPLPVLVPEELDIHTYATPPNSGLTIDKFAEQAFISGLDSYIHESDFISLEDAFGCLD